MLWVCFWISAIISGTSGDFITAPLKNSDRGFPRWRSAPPPPTTTTAVKVPRGVLRVRREDVASGSFAKSQMLYA